MLKPNQIERLILHAQKTLDGMVDQEHISYRQGYIQALKTVLEMDPNTINNNPINKETNKWA